MTLDEIRNLRIEDFNYPLPEERIAKYPLADREQCKLLVYNSHALQGEYRFANVPTTSSASYPGTEMHGMPSPAMISLM